MDKSTKSKAARALWMDRLVEIDTRFELENFVDRVIAADMNHANTDLFNRIFDLLEVLRNDTSIDSAKASNQNLNVRSQRQLTRSPTNASRQPSRRSATPEKMLRTPTGGGGLNKQPNKSEFRTNL